MIRMLAVLAFFIPRFVPDARPATQKVFKVPVDLVLTHAYVTDAEQRPVTGLKPEDFVIADEGVPQAISQMIPARKYHNV